VDHCAGETGVGGFGRPATHEPLPQALKIPHL